MALLDDWTKDLEQILITICGQQCKFKCTCQTPGSRQVKVSYPWELLDDLLTKQFHLSRDYIIGRMELGVLRELSSRMYIARNSIVKAPSRIGGFVYLGENSVIEPFTYVKGPVIIGNNCVVGGEIKRSIILHGTNSKHKSNYAGDSVVGRNCNLGAGVKLSNLKINGKDVVVEYNGTRIFSKKKKLGAILEDGVQIGCNAVLNPGVYVHKGIIINPLQNIKGERRI